MRFRTGPLVSYGYEGDVLLPVEIRVPASIGAPEVRIAARVDWLECQEACLPGRADFVADAARPGDGGGGSHAALFAEARRRLPAKDPGWQVTAQPAPPALRLLVRRRGARRCGAWFYRGRPRVLDHAKPQPLLREGATHRLDLPSTRTAPRRTGSRG